MNITRENIDDLNAVIKVNMSPEDYQENVTTTLRDYAKRADLKGFRKGKVPLSLVKKMVGKGVLLDEINRNLSQKLEEYIRDENLEILGNPLPKELEDLDLDLDANNSYEFEYEIGLSPSIELNYDLKEVPAKYTVEVDDEYLEKELLVTRKRFGEMSNPDVSEEGDILYGKLTVAEASQADIPEDWKFGKDLAAMVALNPERIPSEDFKGKMGGKKAEDVIPANDLSELFRGDEEMRQAFQMSLQRKDEEVNVTASDVEILKKLKFDFEVKKINRMEAVEINQDFFDKVFGPNTVTSEEEFMTKFRGDLEKAFEKDSDKLVRAKVVDALVELNEVQLPDEFLKRWLVRSEEEITEDNVEERYENFSKGLKWSLMVGQIRKDNPDVTVEKEDLEARVREIVTTEYAQGATAENEEMVNKMIEYFMQDQQFQERVYHELIDNKVFDFLFEKFTPKDEKISASEYMKLLT